MMKTSEYLITPYIYIVRPKYVRQNGKHTNYVSSHLLQQLRSGTVSEESRKKMVEILRRVEAGETILPDNVDEPLDSDDDDDDNLAVRMAGMRSKSVILLIFRRKKDKGRLFRRLPKMRPHSSIEFFFLFYIEISK